MKTIKQLAPNQFYFYSDNKIVFQSYETIVCTIENYENGNHPVIKITENQPQSKTTAKYLNKFLSLHTQFNNHKNIF
jgi:predicted ABC-type transport system involved in lysophospholipase L1 biosynthesis ATPase subunit